MAPRTNTDWEAEYRGLQVDTIEALKKQVMQNTMDIVAIKTRNAITSSFIGIGGGILGAIVTKLITK